MNLATRGFDKIMNTQKYRAHYECVVETVELLLLAGYLALFADLCWVIRDYIHSGCPNSLIPIAIMLFVAFVVMTVTIFHYHHKQYRQILHTKLHTRLDACKRKYKRTKAGA